MKKVRVRELTWGDRFISSGILWTVVDMTPAMAKINAKVEWIIARKHGRASTALGSKGYGYIGDSICSFKASQWVEFVPPDIATE